jgi:P-type E1-E2 ATPase
MPFDGVLLQGSILANECSITGESVPVLKKSENIKKQEEIKNSYIFEGSTLIQVNYKQRFS